jgi:two-component system cell cycle sensor histidine kinase/response regulator CckA
MSWLRRSIDVLVRPHPKLLLKDDQRTSRLFAVFMLAHIVLAVIAILATNAQWEAMAGRSTWDDLDLRVVIAGLLAICVAYLALRAGRLRAAIFLYLGATAAVAVIAPFMPDPDTEISTLALAILPVLLGSVLYRARTVLAILATELVAATYLLARSEMLSIRQRGTVANLIIVTAVVGVVIVALRRHTLALEAERLARIREAQAALLRSEEERRSSAERYRWLFEAIADGVFVVDSGGRMLDVNPAACRQLGYERGELVRLTVGDLSTRASSDRDRMFEALRREGRAVFETEHRRKDGTTLPIELSVAAVDLQGERGFIALTRDLTERRAAEADRARLLEQLHHALKMESIGRLAGGVAHDFNNLLTAILGNAELALLDPHTSPPAREALEGIRGAGRNAAALTRQLLAFSRRQVLEPSPVDLNALLEPMRDMLGRVIGEDIQLHFALGLGLWPVHADPNVIEQVLFNLVVNARDAMPKGGVLTIATRNVSLAPADVPQGARLAPGEHVELAVVDTGTGIPPEARANLFEPFFTTKPRGKGTGLGLAMVWGAVTQSGGHVSVESELGRGSAFRILLPRTSAPAVTSRADPVGTVPFAAGETVLLAEDADAVRDIVARQLELLGYRVIRAAHGAEALARAAGGVHIDLLLTDVIMPGMNGRELADRFLALHPGAKVQFMSGYADDEIITRQGVLDPGANLLTKPFTSDQLARQLRAVLDRA